MTPPAERLRAELLTVLRAAKRREHWRADRALLDARITRVERFLAHGHFINEGTPAFLREVLAVLREQRAHLDSLLEREATND